MSGPPFANAAAVDSLSSPNAFSWHQLTASKKASGCCYALLQRAVNLAAVGRGRSQSYVGPKRDDSRPVGATSSISFTFFALCFRNIGMFLEHGTRARPHSVRILIAFSS